MTGVSFLCTIFKETSCPLCVFTPYSSSSPPPPLSAPADYEEPASFTGGTPLPVGSTPDTEEEDEGRTEEGDESDEGEEEPPYADIDADRRNSDYVNADMLNSDSEDGDDGQNREVKYAPSVKLHKHPLLKKSMSHSEVDSGHPNSMIELMKAAKKPKNRAPPPPPGAANKLSPAATRHKRSQSDVHSEGSRDQSSRVGGQRSPIPEHSATPRAPSLSQDRKSPSQGQKRSSHVSPKPMPGQVTGQTSQARSHPVGRVAPSPIQQVHRAAPTKPATPVGGSVGGATGGKARPKSSIPSHPPPPPGPAPPGPSPRKGVSVSAVQSAGHFNNALGEEKGAGHGRLVPGRLVPGHVRPHNQSRSQEQRSCDQEQISPSTKPKRHAPPPPAGAVARKTPTNSPEMRRHRKVPPPPAYAEVMKGWRNRQPPKPARLHHTRSLEDLSNMSETQVGAQGTPEGIAVGNGCAIWTIIVQQPKF